MTDPKDRPPPGTAPPVDFDEGLDVSSVLLFGAGLSAVMLIVLGILGLMLARWNRQVVAHDRRPSAVVEEAGRFTPPEPRLQASPTADMERLRAREQALLTSYGWVDPDTGIGRIPIERAMDLVVEKGLPATPPAASRPGETR